MIYIDNCAYTNKLCNMHPIEKLLLVLLSMIICLTSPTIIVPIIIIALMSFLTIYRAGIPVAFYIHLLKIPVSFIVLGLISITINILNSPETAIFSVNAFGIIIGISEESLSKTILLFFRAFGSLSCLYFLALTTPILDIMSVLRKFKVPEIYLELMALIYRVIFILVNIAGRIYNSQSSRLGYSTIKNQYRSLGLLISNLFSHAYRKTNHLFIALESRCYTGSIRVIEKDYKLCKKHICYIILIEISLLLISLLQAQTL